MVAHGPALAGPIGAKRAIHLGLPRCDATVVPFELNSGIIRTNKPRVSLKRSHGTLRPVPPVDLDEYRCPSPLASTSLTWDSRLIDSEGTMKSLMVLPGKPQTVS